MQVWTWVLVLCLAAGAVRARPEGGLAPLQEVVVVGDDADAKVELVVAAEETRPEIVVTDEAKLETVAKEPEEDMKPMPQPIEPGVMAPEDSKVFPEGSLRSPTPVEDSRVLLEEQPGTPIVVPQAAAEAPVQTVQPTQKQQTRMTRASYLPAEARGADSEDIERLGKPRRGPSRQLTDIHLLFLSHPDHAARVSTGASRRPDVGLGVGALALEPVGEGRSNLDPPATRTPASSADRRTVRKLDHDWTGANDDIEARYEPEPDNGDGQPERMSLFPLPEEETDAAEDAGVDGGIPAARESAILYGGPAHQQRNGYGPQQPVQQQRPREDTVTITTFIPTVTAITRTVPASSVAAKGELPAPGASRITWPLANVFPIVIQDPLLGLYSTWLSGGVSGLTLSNIASNLVEYGPAADVCGGLPDANVGKRTRRARTAQEAESATADDSVRREDDEASEEKESADKDDKKGTLQEKAEGVDGVQKDEVRDDDRSEQQESSKDDAPTTTIQEATTEDAASDEQDSVTVENGENSLPSEAEAYREEEDDDVSEDRPHEAVEKRLRKTKNKVDKRVQKVVSQVGGLTRRVQARIQHVLAESGVHDADTARAEGSKDEAGGGGGPTLTRVVLRRGGVAVAGPGGIATAAFGGTAIVGPGGIAYTAPDSVAVVGPGARVVAVPSERLLDMYRAFRQAGERGLTAFRPAWLGTIPDDGKLVAVGPAVYRNPPEDQDVATRPAHWVFGNTRVLGLRR